MSTDKMDPWDAIHSFLTKDFTTALIILLFSHKWYFDCYFCFWSLTIMRLIIHLEHSYTHSQHNLLHRIVVQIKWEREFQIKSQIKSYFSTALAINKTEKERKCNSMSTKSQCRYKLPQKLINETIIQINVTMSISLKTEPIQSHIMNPTERIL